MSNSTAYTALIAKLDEFIRKYYKNKMIRGGIYCVALILGSYLLVTMLEYFGRFSITMRTFLFWSFILSVTFVLIKNLIIPLINMMKLGSVISHSQAAAIIGSHFPGVRDKLLNTLQLKKVEESGADNSLLEASINQKISALRPVPFSSAIDLTENRKHLKYAIPPLAVILVLLFAAPSILTKPTERLIKHGELIAEEAPFRIKVLNDDLSVAENSDFTIQLELDGAEIPEKVYLVYGGNQYLAEKNNNVQYNYTLRNVQKDVHFSLYAGGFYSDEYELKVLPTPQLIDFELLLDYPAYTKLTDEGLSNTGDLSVPAGTKISWIFKTKNTDFMRILINDSVSEIRNNNNKFKFNHTANKTTPYSIKTANSYFNNRDSIEYRLQVTPDMFPMIAVSEEHDSSSIKQLYFMGEVRDDYGFRRITFNYQLVLSGAENASLDLKTVEIPVTKDNTSDEFFYSWNLDELSVSPGDKISYYFEVWDNDGYNGSKSTRSAMREFVLPTTEELEEKIEEKNEEIKDDLEQSLREAKEMQKDLEELQRQLLEKQEMTWQDKKKIEELIKKQQELQKQVQQIQKENQQKNKQQNEFQQQDERIQEKQKQLEELLQQVMSPELQKLMEELQRLMEELNKEQIQEELEQMQLNNEDLEKELDRALEQFKQLEFEQKMEQSIEKLEKLAEEQEKLSEESEKKESQSDELKPKQDSLNKDFENIKKELDELQKMNEELEDPNKLPETEEQEKQISEEQEKSSEELEKNKKSSASKSQKSAGEKMKQMAAQMKMAMESNQQEEEQQNMEDLRALLENIITLSFDQEEVMSEFKSIDVKDPKYNKLGQTQRKLKDDAKMIEDSLFALSKRVPQLSAAVNHEINLVNENMSKALENIPERKTPEITTSQQYVMTSFNNLALMLDEALKQMQNQSSCNKPGQGNCEKPGGSGKKPSPKPGDMKKMQEQLNKQLEECKKKGENKGESKSGKSGQSKELAEMAAKQAAIRKMMEEKANELNEDGSGNGNELKQIAKEMEELQKDIVNDQVDQESLNRQQDILTRLLKAENAERVREQDNQRKSTEAQNAPLSSPIKYADYLSNKQRETELLKTVPPGLKPYYKDRVNQYFNKLGSN